MIYVENPLKELEHSSPSPNCGLHMMISFPKEESFLVDKSDEHDLSQLIKVNVNRAAMLIACSLDVL